MECKVIWSDAAIADLKDICEYIAKDNPAAAYRLGLSLLDQVAILANFPLIGPAYARDSGGFSREIVYRNYRIFYDVSQDRRMVEILHIWHGARREPRL